MTPFDSPPQYLLEDTYKVASTKDIGSQTSQYSKPLEFRVTVPQSAASWLGDAVAHIEELTSLAPGWDSYDSKPVDAGAAMGAVRFLLGSAYADLPAPAIVPIADGGVQIEWHRGGIDLEVSFSDGSPTIFVEDHKSGEVLDDQEYDPVMQVRRLASRLTDA